MDLDGARTCAVFYSGHGAPGQKGQRGYLLPSDANPDAAEFNGYPINLLYENLGMLEETREVRVCLDARFSGDSHQGMLIRVTMSAGSEGLTAASGKQLASWDEEARCWMFTHHLLDALSRDAVFGESRSGGSPD